MVFKIFLLFVTLLILDANSYPNYPGFPEYFESLKYQEDGRRNAELPRGFVEPQKETTTKDTKIYCKDAPYKCRRDKKDELDKLNFMDIWRVLAERPKMEPIIFVSDTQYVEKIKETYAAENANKQI